jgi:predicted MPP superfamily phosphohydrolase
MSDAGLGRFLVFLVVVLSIWTLMHAYVLWRVWAVPGLASPHTHRLLVAAAALLWVSYPLSRFLYSWHAKWAARPLEFAGATWMGTLFLVFVALLLVDVVTGGGLVLSRVAPVMRGWAVVAAAVLAATALVLGLRDPVVRDYEVRLPGLPAERDGTVLVEVSDIHLGTLIGERWMGRLVDRVNAMKVDIVVVDGDLIDGNVGEVKPLLPVLQRLRAPLGVWAVTGNHEWYAGIDRSVHLFEDAGFTVLRDRWAQVAPGLVMAGVDDLTARRQFGLLNHPVEKALAERPAGATIYLSHSPLRADIAAAAGAGLMLSGHTHDGQIWPFGYLVRFAYPLLGGRYEVDRMPVIVCRGTGTWGPRMRLWLPSEIVRITLRSAPPPVQRETRGQAGP